MTAKNWVLSVKIAGVLTTRERKIMENRMENNVQACDNVESTVTSTAHICLLAPWRDARIALSALWTRTSLAS